MFSLIWAPAQFEAAAILWPCYSQQPSRRCALAASGTAASHNRNFVISLVVCMVFSGVSCTVRCSPGEQLLKSSSAMHCQQTGPAQDMALENCTIHVPNSRFCISLDG